MYFFFTVTLLSVAASFFVDRGKTWIGIKKGIKMFTGILPNIIDLLVILSLVLAIVSEKEIAAYLGKGSGVFGIIAAAVIGSIAMIPGFIAFPLAGIMLKNGASYSVMAVFITTLMMVGVLTLPLESKYFGLRTALIRNGLSFLAAILIGIMIGLFM